MGHSRKIEQEPYVGHLLGVSSLIIEYGGNEDQAIAGLLHDLIEDTDTTPDQIAEVCGPRVVELVLKCTEASKPEKQAYEHLKKSADASERAEYQRLRRERKQKYIDALRHKEKDDDSILVALADKVNNAEKTARDIKDDPELFEKFFNAGRQDQQWWYESLVDAFGEKLLGDTPEGKTAPRNRLYGRFCVAVEQIFTTAANPRD